MWYRLLDYLLWIRHQLWVIRHLEEYREDLQLECEYWRKGLVKEMERQGDNSMSQW